MNREIIDYQDLVKKALKGVLKDILHLVDKNGLIGDQHYYITFKTREKGVVIPKRLASQYPLEMTIVIQHRFWDLKVGEDKFEIGLSFNQKPEFLVVPYSAVISIVDPSQRFALQFDAPDPEETDGVNPAEEPVEKDKKVEEGEEDKVVSLDAFRKP